MKFLDKIALNRLISIITNFIIAILKIFKPLDKDIVSPSKKDRPLIDLFRKIFNKR